MYEMKMKASVTQNYFHFPLLTSSFYYLGMYETVVRSFYYIYIFFYVTVAVVMASVFHQIPPLIVFPAFETRSPSPFFFVFCSPPDALPYMGAIPNYTNAYINAGHNCWGIAWSPACGKIMAELILNGTTGGVDLDPFDPGRFSPQVKNKRGRRGRKRGTTNVGEQW